MKGRRTRAIGRDQRGAGWEGKVSARPACPHDAGKLSTDAAQIMDNARAKRNRHPGDAVLGITTIRPSVALSLAGAAICIAVVAGCAGGEAPSGQPSFYQNLAQPDMTVDPAAAASMISGYRSNNGLGSVSVDPDLMRMANEQALRWPSTTR